MRRGSYILTLALMGVLALLCSPVSAQPYSQHHPGAQVDVGIFYDSLAPQGEWVEMPDYGWSWAPRVERNWRPYTRGQWVMTDDGWFWDSDEQFGWATYHYGRWVNDQYYGWVWVPGTEWAPAWVSWRHGNGYTGWAPLPPRATWQTHVGLNIGGLDIDAFIGSRDYAFVQDRSFVDRGVYQQVLPPTQNVTIINVTNNVTNYTVVNERVVNGGIDVAIVERAVGRRVARARTVDVDRADAPRRARAGEVSIFRPEVRAAPERRPAQGRSLVKGDQPPQLLVERRKQREQEQQQKGNEPRATAKDVQKQGPAGQPRDNERATGQPQTPRKDANTRQQEAQQQRDQARQDADKQRAKNQDQQRLDREKQANDREQRNQQQADQQRAKRDSDAQAQAQARERAQAAQQEAAKQRARERAQAAQQEAAKQRANTQDQQRVDREKRQAKDQEQRDQQQADQQRAKRDSDAQAQAQTRKGAQDAPQGAKDNPKDKGKDRGKKAKPSPTPPPAEQP